MAGSPRRGITVRFHPEVLDLIEREASRQRMSTNEAIRNAAFAWAVFNIARRGDPVPEAWEEAYRAAVRLRRRLGDG